MFELIPKMDDRRRELRSVIRGQLHYERRRVALMCFGCAVPGIVATKALEDEKERRLTIMLSPFFSCGAKLPIWATFAGVMANKTESKPASSPSHRKPLTHVPSYPARASPAADASIRLPVHRSAG